jgi:hypothetical protein
LREDYRFDKDIIALIKAEISPNIDKLPLSIPSFSNYKKASEKGKYETVDYRVYKKICEVLNTYIRTKYKKIWNTNTDKFEVIENEFINKDEKISSRLNDFCGVWKGFSWSKSQSKISILAIEIKDANTIICQTEKQRFIDNEFKFISQDIICFTLKAQSRHIYIIGKVGIRDSFKNISRINLSYTDSGAVNVKCGILVLQKTNEAFDSIVTQRFLPQEIKEQDIVSRLENTQLTADYFE